MDYATKGKVIIKEYEDVVNISPSEISKRKKVIKKLIKGCDKEKYFNIYF